VLIAPDRQLDRNGALKRIKPELALDESSRNRFVREAEITGQLEHPNIAPVYSLGLDRDRSPFYAMRFIDGQPFHEAIAHFHKSGAARSDQGSRLLALRKLLGKYNAVCDAVAFAHSRGVLHRDIKPGNVILGRFEAVVLKAMAHEPGDRYTTATALAEDIEHWLADEPVAACREPLSIRMGRKLRRHRTLVFSTAAALFVGVIDLVGFTLVLAGKNSEHGE
jgi:hypothetical protein